MKKINLSEINALENKLLKYKFFNGKTKPLSHERIILSLNDYLLKLYNECNHNICETYIRYAGYLYEAVDVINDCMKKEFCI